jgi:hypothetical protein
LVHLFWLMLFIDRFNAPIRLSFTYSAAKVRTSRSSELLDKKPTLVVAVAVFNKIEKFSRLWTSPRRVL